MKLRLAMEETFADQLINPSIHSGKVCLNKSLQFRYKLQIHNEEY